MFFKPSFRKTRLYDAKIVKGEGKKNKTQF